MMGPMVLPDPACPRKGTPAIAALGQGPPVLCLHGLTGTPYELAPLAAALTAAGFSVSVPLLAGHGDTAAALVATRWQDWLASARAACDHLQAESGGKPVSILGFSMGGLLGLRLARLLPGQVVSLVLLAVPLRLRPWQMAGIKLWRHLPARWRQGRLAAWPKRGGSDVTDAKARHDNPGLPMMPIAAVAEMVDLAAQARQDLAFVRQPALVVHGQQDRTVRPQTSAWLARSLAASVVEVLRLPRSGHLVGIDVEHSQLAEAIVRFLRQSYRPAAGGVGESRPA